MGVVTSSLAWAHRAQKTGMFCPVRRKATMGYPDVAVEAVGTEATTNEAQSTFGNTESTVAASRSQTATMRSCRRGGTAGREERIAGP